MAQVAATRIHSSLLYAFVYRLATLANDLVWRRDFLDQFLAATPALKATTRALIQGLNQRLSSHAHLPAYTKASPYSTTHNVCPARSLHLSKASSGPHARSGES